MRVAPVLVLSSFAVIVATARPAAQGACGPGQTLLVNDRLPATPPPVPIGVAVVPGLCPGEACAAVFDTTQVGAQVKVTRADVGFFSAFATQGVTAALDLEIFDGVTWNGGVPVLGPSIFRYSQVTGGLLQVSTHGINSSPALDAFGIVASSGKLVVAWWMIDTLSPGNCSTAGYSSNFATDEGGGILGTCTSPPRKNLIYIEGQGWRDAATARAGTPPFVLPICPLYYNGNWILRTCVAPGAGSGPAPQTLGSGTPGTGGIVPTLATTGGEPRIGNRNFGLVVGNGLGAAPGITLLGTLEITAPFAGGTIHTLPVVALPFILGGGPGVAGAGLAVQTLPIPRGRSGVGTVLVFQSLILDAGALQQGVALTPGLRITVCQ